MNGQVNEKCKDSFLVSGTGDTLSLLSKSVVLKCKKITSFIKKIISFIKLKTKT